MKFESLIKSHYRLKFDQFDQLVVSLASCWKNQHRPKHNITGVNTTCWVCFPLTCWTSVFCCLGLVPTELSGVAVSLTLLGAEEHGGPRSSVLRLHPAVSPARLLLAAEVKLQFVLDGFGLGRTPEPVHGHRLTLGRLHRVSPTHRHIDCELGGFRPLSLSILHFRTEKRNRAEQLSH